MQGVDLKLDQLRAAYKAEVEEWIKAIRHEEDLASVEHSVADIDQWELAHDREDQQRKKVLAAKRAYEGALREEHFGF